MNSNVANISRRSRLIYRLRSLNLFKSYPPSTHSYDLQNELISTRLFLFLLISSIIILLVYTSQVTITQTITIENPQANRYRELNRLYPQTLNCPCKNIAIPQNTFITLRPEFHQICTSDFISTEWLAHINAAADTYISDDFSYTGGPFFRTLATFCRSANTSLTNSLLNFNNTRFISSTVLNEEIFTSRILSIINNFKTLAIETFIQPFHFISEMSQTNTLMSGLLTNADVRVLEFTAPYYMVSLTSRRYKNQTCDCSVTASCVTPSVLKQKNGNISMIIPGLYTGCFLVEAARSSSFECFYNRSCLDQLESILRSPRSFNATLLDSSISSRFSIDTSIDTILSQAMIEYWNENYSWLLHYEQCQPIICIYSFMSKFNLIYIITTLVGLIGGLVKSLQFLVPRTVKLIRQRMCTTRPIQEDERSGWNKIMMLNLFESVPLKTDPKEIRQQIYSTRIFLLLFIACIVIGIFYLSLDMITTIYTVEFPSIDQYFDLYKQHVDHSLICLCHSLTTEYQLLVRMLPEFHPFCSSDFVQSTWLKGPALYYGYTGSAFRDNAPPLFRAFAAFCRLAIQQVEEGLLTLNSSQLVTDQVLSQIEFDERINETANSFIRSTISSFARLSNLLEKTTRANTIVSTQGFNFYPYIGGSRSIDIVYNLNETITLGFLYRLYYECICFPSQSCLILMITYDDDIAEALRDMQFFYGCLNEEGARASTLRSLFNQSWVNMMVSWYRFPENSIRALNTNELTQFHVNATIEEILAQNMIDRWNITSFYQAYYENCRPKLCTYSLVHRNNILIVITTVVGLVGGLNSVLKSMIPPILTVLFLLHQRYINGRRNNHRSTSNPIPRKIIVRQWWEKLRNLNLFPSLPPAINQRDIETQIYSTRIFILLLLASVIILSVYSAQALRLKTVVIPSPSVNVYSSIYSRYSQTISCPCKHIAVKHNTFLTLEAKFHQICSSIFVNPQWSDGILESENLVAYDFRVLSPSFFYVISSFCQILNTTIHDGLVDFGLSTLITNHVMPEDELRAQGLALMKLFIETTANSFINTLQTIRETTYANAFISGLATNVQLSVLIEPRNNTLQTAASYSTYENCSCADTPSCSRPAGIYDSNNNLEFYIPGIRIGCYAIDAAMQSSLILFYNQTLIDTLLDLPDFVHPNDNIFVLDPSLDRQSSSDQTIGMLVENLMIDEWTKKHVSFSAYFNQCQPYECRYTYLQRLDTAYMISTSKFLLMRPLISRSIAKK